MATFDATFGGRPFTLRLTMVVASQDVVNNQSTISWSLVAIKTTSQTPYRTDSAATYSFNYYGSGNWGPYNFNGAVGQTITIASGSFVVNHTADGTLTLYPSFAADAKSTMTTASGSGTFVVTTIPRATQPTVTPTSGETGSTFTIGHTPATSTFTHDVACSVDGGTTYTDIVTGLVGTDTSTDWTPAHSLLPNTTSLTAIIRVITKSGATVIGTKTVNLPLTVPTSVKPTISSVVFADAQTSTPDMPSLMGGMGCFVQRWSKLIPTVTSAGAGGSTVVDTDVTIGGQTTDSGVAFGLPVALSGSVPYSAVATDSRGRNSDPYANTVAVTAYNFPSLPTPLVTRTSDAAGLIPSPTGTYLAITPGASVSSLNFSGEKNLLEWQVRTRPAGGSWTTKQAWTSSTVSGNTWTTKAVFGSYSASAEWEVEVSIRDLFGKNGYDTANTVKTLTIPIPSESVFMDWSGADMLGLFQYAQYPGLNVGDTIYQEGLPVVDFGDVATTSLPGISELATDAETITGTDTTRTVTPHGLAAAIPAARDAGLFDTRYYTETEVDTQFNTNSKVGRRRVIPPSASKAGGGTIVADPDGTIRVTASGPTAISIDDVFQIGKNYEIDIIGLTSANTNNQLRWRKALTDYTAGSGYVFGGVFSTMTWVGTQTASGYSAISSSMLLSVNGGGTAWTKLFIQNTDLTSSAFVHYTTNSRQGSQQTYFTASADSGAATQTGMTFIAGAGVFNAGTQIRIWELE